MSSGSRETARCLVILVLSVETPVLVILASLHRFPASIGKRAVWLRVFQLDESGLKPYSRVCSRHFPDGDAKKKPEVNLGKRFTSPKKRDYPRAKRLKRRDSVNELAGLRLYHLAPVGQ